MCANCIYIVIEILRMTPFLVAIDRGEQRVWKKLSKMEHSHKRTALSYIAKRRSTDDKISLDGNNLSIPDLVKACENPTLDFIIADKALQEVSTNFSYLEKKLQSGLVVYGINTGFGGSAEVRSWKLKEVQRALIRHVTAGMGREFSSQKVRAAMITRANCLLKAYSGVRPVVIKTLVDMINNDISPVVPLRGSVSASGDLMPLGYIAAAMTGLENSEVIKDGKRIKCKEALSESGIEPLVLGPKEGLAIINADSFAAGISAQVLYDANILLLLTQICTGLSIEALKGRTESFHPVIHDCLPHVGQREIARNMLAILDESKLAITTLDMYLPDKYGVLKQDRYSLRSSPQWLGPVAETLLDACRRITIELNSSNDNPIIDHRTDTIAHGANFQGETMSVSMDQTRQSLGLCGKLLFAQFSEVINSKLNFGLPPNLSGCDINIDFGFKGCDTAMASYMSELDHFVNPMSNHVLSAESHNQSVNSMALVSARFTGEAIEILQLMITNLLLLTAQAVDLRHLRSLVMEEIRLFVRENPALEKPLNDLEWYDCLFLPEETLSKITKEQQMEEKLKTRRLFDKLSGLYQQVCDGSIETQLVLGQGTRKMYTFIRKTLKIPFYCGQNGINLWLQKILESIVNRDMEPILQDIFCKT